MKRRGREPNHFPVASIALTSAALLIGILVFLMGDDPARWFRRYGLVPRAFWLELAGSGPFWQGDRWYTPFTALFLHLDWIHLLGNLAFFWLFAQRIERRTGAVWFLILVVACGVLANLVSAWRIPETSSAIIGASGATAALLGAFLVLYPTAHLGVILPLGFYWQLVRVPGIVLIGSWFLLQVLYTLASDRPEAIAWWSHVAGFAFGLILAAIGRILGVIRH